MTTIRVQATQPGDPPEGTIRTDAAGELIVYLGPEVAPEQIAELAPAVRQVRLATLVAPSLEVAREARCSIQRYGRPPKTPTTAAMRLPPAPVLRPRGRCGAPTVTGTPCRAWAGSGTTSRVGPCRLHAGNAAGREQQLEELAEHAARWIALTAKADTQPLTTAEQRVSLTAARALLIARRDGLLR